jgi:hypothetical protein
MQSNTPLPSSPASDQAVDSPLYAQPTDAVSSPDLLYSDPTTQTVYASSPPTFNDSFYRAFPRYAELLTDEAVFYASPNHTLYLEQACDEIETLPLTVLTTLLSHHGGYDKLIEKVAIDPSLLYAYNEIHP